LEQLALLKIDAEGVDIQVLKGANKTIERLQPFIFIEVNIAYPENNEAIIAYLRKLNYQLYWLASHREQELNFFKHKVESNGGDLNILAFPPHVNKHGLMALLSPVVSANDIQQGRVELMYLTE